MASDPPVLGFDTSAAHCAAALLSGDRVLAARAEDMARGQAERLMPLLQDMLDAAGVGWAELGRIGVGTGPGNFTGTRISVAAARGLALALRIPAVGVSTFDVIEERMGAGHLACVAAPRGLLCFRPQGGAARIGPAAEARALGLPLAFVPAPLVLAQAVARLAAAAPGDAPRPAPLYVRPADAAPMREAAPVILDG